MHIHNGMDTVFSEKDLDFEPSRSNIEKGNLELSVSQPNLVTDHDMPVKDTPLNDYMIVDYNSYISDEVIPSEHGQKS